MSRQTTYRCDYTMVDGLPPDRTRQLYLSNGSEIEALDLSIEGMQVILQGLCRELSPLEQHALLEKIKRSETPDRWEGFGIILKKIRFRPCGPNSLFGRCGRCDEPLAVEAPLEGRICPKCGAALSNG